jgi:hypothetical protein
VVVADYQQVAADPFPLPHLVVLNSCGVQGRGPTKFIWPRSTLKIWAIHPSTVAVESASRNDARIICSIQFRHRGVSFDPLREMTFVGPGLDVHLHRPELEDHETFPTMADAFLPEKNRSGRSELNPQRQKQHERQPQRHAEQNTGEVQNRFPRDWKRGRRGRVGGKGLIFNCPDSSLNPSESIRSAGGHSKISKHQNVMTQAWRFRTLLGIFPFLITAFSTA